MTRKDIQEKYSQSIYQIQLGVAMETYAQFIANNTTDLSSSEYLVKLATNSLLAGTIFVERMLLDDEPFSSLK